MHVWTLFWPLKGLSGDTVIENTMYNVDTLRFNEIAIVFMLTVCVWNVCCVNGLLAGFYEHAYAFVVVCVLSIYNVL